MMLSRTYGQFCGLARAMELVGERWSMLIVRDLLLGSKRLAQLRQTLPRIPSSTLSQRLSQLEGNGIIQVVDPLDAEPSYELTEYGAELDEIVLRLGLWGARSLGEPTAEDTFTLDSAILSLYTMFRTDAAAGVRAAFELRMGEHVVHAVVDDGALQVAEGPLATADLRIEAKGNLRPLYAGELTAEEALDRDLVSVTGDPALLECFTELFAIPAAPVVAVG
jgi:DNA-binding HxlR family transcriptional regulator